MKAIVIGIAAAVLILALIVRFNAFRALKSVFKDEYRSVIKDSFSGDKKREKQFYRGLYWFNKHRYDKAVEAFSALWELRDLTEQERGTLRFFQGICAECQNEEETAISCYEEAIRFSPDCDRALSNLGLLYQKKHRLEEAEALMLRAAEINPDNPYPYNNLAHLYLAENRNEEAVAMAERAYGLRDWLYQAAMALAIGYARLGKEQEAEVYYDRCRELGRCDLVKLREKMKKVD